MMARYTLFELGPDNSSTYPECWGTTATSPGRPAAKAATIAGLTPTVNDIEHDNWWIRGPGGRCVAGNRAEFFALPAVAKAIAASRREEG